MGAKAFTNQALDAISSHGSFYMLARDGQTQPAFGTTGIVPEYGKIVIAYSNGPVKNAFELFGPK